MINSLSESLIVSSLSGSMIYTLSQSNFSGVARFLAFIISFFMGIVFADLTAEILSGYMPHEIRGNQSIGAFICSTLIVTLAIRVISYMENDLMKDKDDGK